MLRGTRETIHHCAFFKSHGHIMFAGFGDQFLDAVAVASPRHDDALQRSPTFQRFAHRVNSS
jgi:hypothetical protein